MATPCRFRRDHPVIAGIVDEIVLLRRHFILHLGLDSLIVRYPDLQDTFGLSDQDNRRRWGNAWTNFKRDIRTQIHNRTMMNNNNANFAANQNNTGFSFAQQPATPASQPGAGFTFGSPQASQQPSASAPFASPPVGGTVNGGPRSVFSPTGHSAMVRSSPAASNATQALVQASTMTGVDQMGTTLAQMEAAGQLTEDDFGPDTIPGKYRDHLEQAITFNGMNQFLGYQQFGQYNNVMAMQFRLQKKFTLPIDVGKCCVCKTRDGNHRDIVRIVGSTTSQGNKRSYSVIASDGSTSTDVDQKQLEVTKFQPNDAVTYIQNGQNVQGVVENVLWNGVQAYKLHGNAVTFSADQLTAAPA